MLECEWCKHGASELLFGSELDQALDLLTGSLCKCCGLNCINITAIKHRQFVIGSGHRIYQHLIHLTSQSVAAPCSPSPDQPHAVVFSLLEYMFCSTQQYDKSTQILIVIIVFRLYSLGKGILQSCCIGQHCTKFVFYGVSKSIEPITCTLCMSRLCPEGFSLNVFDDPFDKILLLK